MTTTMANFPENHMTRLPSDVTDDAEPFSSLSDFLPISATQAETPASGLVEKGKPADSTLSSDKDMFSESHGQKPPASSQSPGLITEEEHKILDGRIPEELRYPHHDILLLHTDTAYKLAKEFKIHLETEKHFVIDSNRMSVLLWAELNTYHCQRFTSMQLGLKICTYVFILVTPDLKDCGITRFLSEECLMKSIQDSSKRWSFVPVFTQGRMDLPLGLNSLTGINYYRPDEFYLDRVRSIFDKRKDDKIRREHTRQKEIRHWKSKELCYVRKQANEEKLQERYHQDRLNALESNRNKQSLGNQISLDIQENTDIRETSNYISYSQRAPIEDIDPSPKTQQNVYEKAPSENSSGLNAPAAETAKKPNSHKTTFDPVSYILEGKNDAKPGFVEQKSPKKSKKNIAINQIKPTPGSLAENVESACNNHLEQQRNFNASRYILGNLKKENGAEGSTELSCMKKSEDNSKTIEEDPENTESSSEDEPLSLGEPAKSVIHRHYTKNIYVIKNCDSVHVGDKTSSNQIEQTVKSAPEHNYNFDDTELFEESERDLTSLKRPGGSGSTSVKKPFMEEENAVEDSEPVDLGEDAVKLMEESTMVCEQKPTKVNKKEPILAYEKELTADAKKELIKAGKKKLTPSGNKELTPSGNEELTPSGNKELTPAGSKELTLAGNKELTPAGNKELIQAGNKELTPAGSKELTPAGNKELTPAGTKELTPAGNKELTLSGNKELTPAGSKELTLAGEKVLTTAGSKELTPAGNKELTPAGNKELTPAGNKELTLSGNKELTPAGSKELTLAGEKVLTTAGSKELTPAGNKELTPAANKELTLAGNEELTPAGEKVLTPCEKKFTLAGDKELTLAGDQELTLAGEKVLSSADEKVLTPDGDEGHAPPGEKNLTLGDKVLSLYDEVEPVVPSINSGSHQLEQPMHHHLDSNDTLHPLSSPGVSDENRSVKQLSNVSVTITSDVASTQFTPTQDTLRTTSKVECLELEGRTIYPDGTNVDPPNYNPDKTNKLRKKSTCIIS